jgi:hypothetical protein
MGNFQDRGIGYDLVPKKQDINVQGPFPPAPFPAPFPPVRGLDMVNQGQKFPGGSCKEAGNRGIEEPGLILHVEGFGFNNGRRPQTFEDPA